MENWWDIYPYQYANPYWWIVTPEDVMRFWHRHWYGLGWALGGKPVPRFELTWN